MPDSTTTPTDLSQVIAQQAQQAASTSLDGMSVHQLKRPLQYSGLIATRRRNGHGLQQFYFFPAEEAGK